MKYSTLLVATIVSLNLSAFAQSAPVGTTQEGTASWYGSECRGTASGERYNPESMTAAHRTLPFGTMVRVTHLRSRKCAIVRINNRGPYIKGRIIDVSRAAARELGFMKNGIAKVKVEVIPREAASGAE